MCQISNKNIENTFLEHFKLSEISISSKKSDIAMLKVK